MAWGVEQYDVIGNLPDRKMAVCLGYMKNATDSIQRLKCAFVSAIPDVSTVAITHASSTSMDQHCGSTGDVIVVSYKSRYQIIPKLVETLNDCLPDSVRVLQVTELSPKSRLNAETSCTQYIYHYLLPLSWLPGGQEATTWWLQKEREASSAGEHISRSKTKPVLLKNLKQILSFLEDLPSLKEQPWKPAKSGRFGTLAKKSRLSFHNYDSSGTDDWKSIDRAKVFDFLSCGDRVSVIIELRGDSPLPVRRIIGTIIAMLQQREWLPTNFMEISTHPGVIVDVPLAPPLHYLAGCRYDFDEVRWGHKLFSVNDRIDVWKQALQEKHCSKLSDADQWLSELESLTCPAILQQLINVPLDDVTTVDIPLEYRSVVSQLYHIVNTGRWPATSAGRSRILREGLIADSKTGFPLGTFTLVNTCIAIEGLATVQGNQLFPDLVHAIFALENELIAKRTLTHRRPSTHCAINFNVEFTPHLDSGIRGGNDTSLIVGIGTYSGGGLVVEGIVHNIRHCPLEFDGWNQWHWTEPFQGDRMTLVFFTPALRDKSSSHDATTLNSNARQSIQRIQERTGMPTLHFRHDSTDTLVVQELLDGTCVYNRCPRMHPDRDNNLFSPKDHVVLDVGAHIGVYSWYALAEGCHRVIAFEPETSNFQLLTKNLQHFGSKVAVHQAAVAQCELAGKRQFVLGTTNNQVDGTVNTWRHSLKEYSTYCDDGEESEVECVPFFGPNGVLTDDVTFVKLDCEGAELDILLSVDAADGRKWRNVTRVVFEWSLTKNRSIAVFHDAVDHLRHAGFEVRYEGEGAQWDTADGSIWPYHNDLLVFALRRS